MKKLTLVLILVLCVTSLLAACSSSKEVISITEYTAKLYESSVGGVEDESTERYDGERFDTVNKYTKNGKSKKVDNTFGHDLTLTYDWTLKSEVASYEIDEYSFVKDRSYTFVSYRSDTNRIVKYETNAANDRKYISVVNPNSTESEFVSYAKDIFHKYSGIPVDDWDVKIQTWRAEYGYEDRFINYPHDIPANNAEYIITFSKKIGDIERSDKMHIRMTNLGEVIELNAVNYDQSFAPYAELQIDQSKIEEAAWNAFDNIRNNHSIESQKIQNIELVIQDDSLWAQVTIEYSLGETKGGVIYVIQVAELK